MTDKRENRTIPFTDSEWEAVQRLAVLDGLPSRSEYFRNRLRKDCKKAKIDLQALAHGLNQAGEGSE